MKFSNINSKKKFSKNFHYQKKWEKILEFENLEKNVMEKNKLKF